MFDFAGGVAGCLAGIRAPDVALVLTVAAVPA